MRAEAYSRRYRFLNSLELPQGVFDLAANIPNRSVRLLAPADNLVADRRRRREAAARARELGMLHDPPS